MTIPDIHRLAPAVAMIPREMRGDSSRFSRMRAQCINAGLLVTSLREVILHGILRAGDDASANDIWKTLERMVEGHAPSYGAIKRNLSTLVDHGILSRTVGSDRVWRYHISCETPPTHEACTITLIDHGTGAESTLDIPEIAELLDDVANKYGLALRSAEIAFERR